MMTTEYKQSLTELNIIIHYMDSIYLNKLPKKFIEFVNNNMDTSYMPNISRDIPIHKQKLKKDTKVLLSLLYRNYWCEKEEKQELLKEDFAILKKQEEELYEKYNPDNIFKNKEQEKDINKETQETFKNLELIEYEELSWYKRIFENIKNYFMKLFKKC